MSTISSAQTTSGYAMACPLVQDPRSGLSAMLVLAADILGLSLILWAFLGDSIIGRYAAPGGWLPTWMLLPLFLVLYWSFDSYPGVTINPVAEIRRISLANASAFLFISVMLLLHGGTVVPQLICFSACVGASLVVPAIRALIRRIGSKFDWWGYPVVLFGGGTVALLVLRRLVSQPHLGLRPVAVIADHVADREMDGISVFRSADLGKIASSGVRHAIVAAPELSQSDFAEMIERAGDAFPNLILIPNTDFI
jgi:FlaA1/EpsC-like NDP-sugar epimerase